MPSPESSNKNNSLLIAQGLPNYTQIDPETIKKQIPKLLESLYNEFYELEQTIELKLADNDQIAWDDVMPHLQRIAEKIRWSWGTVSHLNGVSNSNELREAYSKQQPDIIQFSNKIGQSRTIYNALNKIKSSQKNLLTITQERILESELIAMEQLGIGLDPTTQKKFNATSEKLAELSNTFSNHVLDATQQWSLLLSKTSEVEGLPKSALEILAEAAKAAGDLNQEGGEPTPNGGPWRLGLDMPRYIPFLKYGASKKLREKIYKAYVKRASEGELNNQPVINEILKLKFEQANRLGYKNWADLSLTRKMAKDVDSVEKLLEELRLASFKKAKEELSEIQACAARNSNQNLAALDPWDLNYWSEKLRQEKFNLNQESLRPWFPMPQVLNGLFNLCQRLFGITIQAADGEAPIWHEDVRFFKIHDIEGSQLAAFYLDPYSRPKNKRGGAWMDECLIRNKKEDGTVVLPVAYLVCNQTPPIGNTPSLMSFEEVETLFHEFGHGLQHMLTTVDYPQAAGINNIEWDAVEFASQFMENWCLDRRTLFDIAKHWETGEPLPEKEFKKLLSCRTFNSGLATLRQVHLALTDLKLHSQWNSSLGISPNEFRLELSKGTTVIPPIKEDHLLCSFSHIFSGGYAAGYYSYKWAEVLSADAFAAFEEVGLDKEDELKATGKRFRETVLSLGGSLSPTEVFKSFRGRTATTEALIRHAGLK